MSDQLLYQGKTLGFHLTTYQVGGKPKTYEIVRHPGAVVMIPIDASGKILFVRQLRRAVNRFLVELPAGTLDPEEDPLHCAQRELQEETGFRAEKLTSLKGFYCAPGFCDEYLHLFLAEDLMPSPLPPDEDEDLELLRMTLPDAIKAIEEGTICDAKSIVGILRYAVCKKHGSF